MSSQIRDEAIRLAPTSLGGDEGDAMVYCAHVVSDTILDWYLSGFLARFPMFCPESGLARQQRDRRLIRGPEEPANAFRSRLRRFRHAHKTFGNAYSVISQLGGYFTPHAVVLRIWTNDGMVYTRTADGALSWARKLGTWNWDGNAAAVERFWLIIYPPSTLWVPTPTFTDGAWGAAVSAPTRCVGFTATQAELAGVREVISQAKSLNSVCEGIIVAFDPATFAPDTPEPDGGWFKWSVAGVPYTAKRLSSARYCQGVT